jgi:hypothetical protein
LRGFPGWQVIAASIGNIAHTQYSVNSACRGSTITKRLHRRRIGGFGTNAVVEDDVPRAVFATLPHRTEAAMAPLE